MRSRWKALREEAEAEAAVLRAEALSSEGVLIACSSVPPELFERRGLRTRRIVAPGTVSAESLGEAAAAGHEVCAWCKGIVGELSAAETVNASLLVCSTGCDQMKRALEIAARRRGLPFEVMNLPATRSPNALSLLEYELERLDAVAASLPGSRGPDPSAVRLRERCRRALSSLEGRVPHRLFAALVQLSFVAEPARFLEFVSRVPAGDGKGKGVPLALAGGPVSPSEGAVIDALERAGGFVAADLTCTGGRAALRRAAFEPRDMAQALFEAPPCIGRRPNEPFYDYARSLIEERGVRGVVWKSPRFCDLWHLEARRAAARLGVPVLAVDATAGDSGSPRLLTRLEAFVESLAGGP